MQIDASAILIEVDDGIDQGFEVFVWIGTASVNNERFLYFDFGKFFERWVYSLIDDLDLGWMCTGSRQAPPQGSLQRQSRVPER